MLQNARIIAFTVSELLRENQQGGIKGFYQRFTMEFFSENS